MALSEVRIIPVRGIPEVAEGADLPSLIAGAMGAARLECVERDVLVIAQKIVSKSEGRVVRLDSVEPSQRAREWAEAYAKDARVVEVVLRESKRIVRMERGVMICETRHGLVCANAGVDASNAAEGTVVVLPEDPDASARRMRLALERLLGVKLAVIVADTFGRPWREGLVNVALGVAGLAPLMDYRGRKDWHGRLLSATVIAIADELASAAELVMGKSDGVPVAIIRGANFEDADGSACDIIRPAENDLFR